jgi:uncharacterized membrane protein YeaQ/YmgE (transglycosylase-associated protein family)
MSALELSPAVQHWVNVALIWVGFGALAGLSARIILPLRRPTAHAGTLVVGVLGSTLGLLVLSLLTNELVRNPIGPLGFVASLMGTLVVLVLYQPLAVWRESRAAESVAPDPPQPAAPV